MVESSEKLNNHAIELAAQGDFAEAITCFKRALSLENGNPLLWLNLGLTYRDAGDFHGAYKALETAFSINPYNDQVIETMADVCFHLKKLDEAFSYCVFGAKVNPENSHIWNNMGVIFFNQKNFLSAAEAFESALTLNPYYYDALFNLRDTYLELGNNDGAAECKKRMKELRNSGKM